MADEFYIDNELLIPLVEQRPVLWDKYIDEYKNRVATKAAWKEITIILNPDLEMKKENTRRAYAKLIIQRWTHIRDNYNRSYKKIQERKRTGSGFKVIKPYRYSKQLSFLQKVIQPQETTNVTTKNSNTKTEIQEDHSETNDTSDVNSIETNDIETKNPIPKHIPEIPMKNDISLLDSKMEFMDSYPNIEPKIINRHLSFFYGILPSFDTFDEDEVLEFQMGVLQLLKKIKNSRHNR